jgi:non-histone protein 10
VRESAKEGFDMHKALAQAWRDLKQEGQKPYFDEYEKHKKHYRDKMSEMKDSSAAATVATSLVGIPTGLPASGMNYEAGETSPLLAAAIDDADVDSVNQLSDSGFTAVNR